MRGWQPGEGHGGNSYHHLHRELLRVDGDDQHEDKVLLRRGAAGGEAGGQRLGHNRTFLAVGGPFRKHIDHN